MPPRFRFRRLGGLCQGRGRKTGMWGRTGLAQPPLPGRNRNGYVDLVLPVPQKNERVGVPGRFCGFERLLELRRGRHRLAAGRQDDVARRHAEARRLARGIDSHDGNSFAALPFYLAGGRKFQAQLVNIRAAILLRRGPIVRLGLDLANLQRHGFGLAGAQDAERDFGSGRNGRNLLGKIARVLDALPR